MKTHINLQGKEFPLYGYILDLAHTKGLRSIETQILSGPDGETGLTIIKARVTMESGQVFEGIGDASVKNVNRMIGPHIIRMAETRAKARALRDAVNIGTAAFEELGGED